MSVLSGNVPFIKNKYPLPFLYPDVSHCSYKVSTLLQTIPAYSLPFLISNNNS